ncbi:TatD family hydrolase [Brevibacterium sp. p3-SID960]|uniref:TatD family hydrolase n=1 Tax=Brevibacterium sp. p3-SID960 TaxID=2916063 RepID=UPI0021A7683B|nr:TatD family hydrolase [Brevibacterium sp. p3-SID960]MCT1691109.1 TatD family hydrolase [Brevibacterium sp. p3-SID960]
MASRAAGTYPEVPQPLNTPGVDTHCHLDIGVGARGPIKDGEPAPEVEPEADETFPPLSFFFDTATAANITRIVQIGCEMASARWTAEVVAAEAAAGRDWMLGGVAIHPNEAPRLAVAGLLEESLTEIEQLAGAERIRVVGETGLDYYRTADDGAADQQESFRAHIEMAKRLDKVLQIHDREAHADVLRILAEEGAPAKTVFHCFSGDVEMARICAERGYYMSFAGNVTFKRSDDLRHAASVVPDELLLTETDAPFLTPHPHRGKPGGPYLTALTVRKLAEVRGVGEAHIAEVTTANAERIFGSWALN